MEWTGNISSPSPALPRERSCSGRSRIPWRSRWDDKWVNGIRWKVFIISTSIHHIVYEVIVLGMRSIPSFPVAWNKRQHHDPWGVLWWSSSLEDGNNQSVEHQSADVLVTQGHSQPVDRSRQRPLPRKRGWSHLYGKHHQSGGLELGKFLGDEERMQVTTFNFRSFCWRFGTHVTGGTRPPQFPDQS